MRLQRVLFLCTHNSARSQMAEGFLRALARDPFEAESAGTEETRVHPLAIRAMAEVGIDLSGHRHPGEVLALEDDVAGHCGLLSARAGVSTGGAIG